MTVVATAASNAARARRAVRMRPALAAWPGRKRALAALDRDRGSAASDPMARRASETTYADAPSASRPGMTWARSWGVDLRGADA